jgi:hypothetical protein
MEEVEEIQQDTEWQPARIAPAAYAKSIHNQEGPYFDRTWAKDQGKLIHVTPRAVIPAKILEDFRRLGCDAEVFVQVRPDEVAFLGYDPGVALYMCIHQVLTD